VALGSWVNSGRDSFWVFHVLCAISLPICGFKHLNRQGYKDCTEFRVELDGHAGSFIAAHGSRVRICAKKDCGFQVCAFISPQELG
jgi:hypothetical protein